MAAGFRLLPDSNSFEVFVVRKRATIYVDMYSSNDRQLQSQSSPGADRSPRPDLLPDRPVASLTAAGLLSRASNRRVFPLRSTMTMHLPIVSLREASCTDVMPVPFGARLRAWHACA